jgi:NAD-dependent DNA ligase
MTPEQFLANWFCDARIECPTSFLAHMTAFADKNGFDILELIQGVEDCQVAALEGGEVV